MSGGRTNGTQFEGLGGEAFWVFLLPSPPQLRAPLRYAV